MLSKADAVCTGVPLTAAGGNSRGAGKDGQASPGPCLHLALTTTGRAVPGRLLGPGVPEDADELLQKINLGEPFQALE